MMLLAKRVSAKRESLKIASTSSADDRRRIRSKTSAAFSLVSIRCQAPKGAFYFEKVSASLKRCPDTKPIPPCTHEERDSRKTWLKKNVAQEKRHQLPLYADPMRILRKRAGLAPCPVPTTC